MPSADGSREHWLVVELNDNSALLAVLGVVYEYVGKKETGSFTLEVGVGHDMVMTLRDCLFGPFELITCNPRERRV